jgi:hypothetical protein
MSYENLNKFLTPETVNTADLLFDPTNPRLFDLGDPKPCAEAKYGETGRQETIFQNLLENFEARDLAKKIRGIGFLKTDRIIVRRLKADPTKYVVVEGNRRVCAMKFLIKEHQAGEEIDAGILEDISRPEALVIDETGKSPEQLSGLYKLLQAARHIGPAVKSWGPYQQAKMIASLKANGKKSSEAADMLGISAKEGNALWRAYHALEQMNGDEDYKDQADPSLFSYFYEALKVPAVKDWLDAQDEGDSGFSFKNKKHLGHFYGMITKPEEGEQKKLPMAINVRKLGQIVGNSDALKVLLSTEGTLEKALTYLDDDIFERDFEPTVKSCRKMLEELSHEKVQNLSSAHQSLLTELKKEIDKALKNHRKLNA